MRHHNLQVTGSVSVNGISAATAADLGAYTGSNDTKVSTLQSFTASLSATNTFTASANSRLDSIETISASNIARINEIEIITSSANARLNSIENFTASVNNTNTFTASATLRLNDLETKSASVDTLNTEQNTRLTNLEIKTGSLATTGSNTFIGTQTITGSLFISANLIVQGTSSLENITASAVSIGTNIVNLNTANPAIRYAGLVIGDSGSVGGSGSFLYDSVQDEMIFVHRGTSTTVTSSVILMGPQTYDSVGSETYPTLNRIQKGTGNEHLSDSNIFDNGTNIRLLSSTEITGSLNIGATSYPSVNLYTTSGTNFAITNRYTDNRLSIDRIGTGELVNILSNGSVGIGTTSTVSNLDVIATNNDTNQIVGYFGKTGGNTYGSTILRIARTAGTTNTGSLSNVVTLDLEVNSGGSGPYRYGTYADGVITSMAAANNGPFGSIHLVTSGSIRMTIGGGTIAGSVGIGTTNPARTFHVMGGAAFDMPSVGLVVQEQSGTSQIVSYKQTGGTYSDLHLRGANLGIVINGSNGNVGIGTTDTTFRLQVLGDSRLIQTGDTVALYLDNSNVAHATRFRFRKNGTDYFSLDLRGSGESDVLNFYRYSAGNWSNPIITFRNDSNNVGINTTTPSNLLSIRGNMDMGATGLSYVGPSQYGGIMFPRGQILFSNTNTQNQFYLSSNAYTNSSGVFAYRNSSQPTLALGLDNGQFSFNTAGNGTADATISWNVPLIVDNTGVYTANTNTPINLKPENTPATPITSLSSASATYNQRPGVYWLGFGGNTFLGYVRFNWHQGRNWVLALKMFNVHDMTSGSPLWQNNTLVNQSDFDLNNGRMAKYAAWNHFAFNRVLYTMGNRIPPIMQWSSNKTSLYSVFSSITPGNPSGLPADSTDPQISTSATVAYNDMTNFLGPNFVLQSGGQENNLGMYGLGSFANNSTNAGSAGNTGHSSGFGLVDEHLGSFSGLQTLGRAGAWIGTPLDEGGHVFNTPSNSGADSGFGLGVGGGNLTRTSSSGIISWSLGTQVANFLPAYVWLSVD